jgi:uncharacterized ferritin-like protein (DUF455 family)
MTAAPLHPSLDPSLFGEPPARDARFVVVDVWADCDNLPADHPEKLVEFLNRQLNEELHVLENAARSLAQFPNAPWETRMWLARQCADEARHALIYRRALERRGRRVGEFPVLNFQYRLLGKVDTLIGRLAVQNRTFEADGLDAVTHGIEEMRQLGEMDIVDMYDAQQADEVLHVRFANEYINARVRADPREALAMSRALTQAAKGFKQVFAGGGTNVTKYGVAQEWRAAAGFAPTEIAVAVEMSDRRRAAVRAQYHVE